MKKSIHWVEKNNEKYAGLHLLAEFWGGKSIENIDEIKNILTQSANVAECAALEFAAHQFEPQGITAFVILEESHLSIHTWPEEKYMAIDIFTCGDKAKPKKALNYLKKQFQPTRVDLQEIKRGIK